MAPRVVHLDTHLLVWLHVGLLDRIPSAVQEILEASDLRVSPIAVLELEYLFEIGRLEVGAAEVMAHLSTAIGSRLAEEPFAAVATAACAHRWTRDPFDRIIVAQAEVARADLVTKDETIHQYYEGARWG